MSNSARQHFSYQPNKMIRCVLVILFIACTSFILKAQNSDTAACAEQGTLDVASLPANMRFIVERVGEQTLYLHNPHDGTEISIPNTNGLHDYWEFPAFPLLYDEATRLLVVRFIVGNRTLLQIMNLDGSGGATVGESAGIPQLLTDNRVRSGHNIIDLHTFGVRHLEMPELIGMSERTFVKYSPDGERFAYYAEDIPNTMSDSKFVRIYNFNTQQFIDIDLQQWLDEPRPGFDWHNHPYLLTIQRWDGDAYIYNSNTGELVFILSASSIGTDYQPSEISWSPNGQQIAVFYNVYPNPPYPIISIQSLERTTIDYCFVVETKLADPILSSPDEHRIFWTPDSQFIWWLECKVGCNWLSDIQANYDLLIANIETGEFGVALSDVG